MKKLIWLVLLLLAYPLPASAGFLQDIADLLDDVAELFTAVGDASDDLADAVGDINIVKVDVDDLEDNIDDLENDTSALEGDITSLNTQMTQVGLDVGKVEFDIGELRDWNNTNLTYTRNTIHGMLNLQEAMRLTLEALPCNFSLNNWGCVKGKAAQIEYEINAIYAAFKIWEIQVFENGVLKGEMPFFDTGNGNIQIVGDVNVRWIRHGQPNGHQYSEEVLVDDCALPTKVYTAPGHAFLDLQSETVLANNGNVYVVDQYYSGNVDVTLGTQSYGVLKYFRHDDIQSQVCTMTTDYAGKPYLEQILAYQYNIAGQPNEDYVWE